jgi:tRNA(Glu) U13 pseudouridine synthase TruD
MDPEEQLRNDAWIGDAVLALFARSWLLQMGQTEYSKERNRLFELWVSNQFLSSFGEPTSVEAAIGRSYANGGLAAAFTYIEENLLKRFIQTARNRGFNLAVAGRPSANSVETTCGHADL